MPEQQENQTEVFHLKAPFKPTGDQPQAIEALVQGLKAGDKGQTLLGVRLFEAEPRRPQGHFFLGGLPVGLAEKVVGAQLVETGGKGAFALLFAADGRMSRHDGRRREQKSVSASCSHHSFLLYGADFICFLWYTEF